MQKKNQYLIALRRKDGSRDVYIPSLEKPENAGLISTAEFIKTTLSAIGPAQFEINFTSQPDEFGILSVTCDIRSAELVQTDQSRVAAVLNIHERCITEPWDLLPHLKDGNTQKAFAELRNERRFQKDVESHWSSVGRTSLRYLCADIVEPAGDYFVFNLPAVGKYLGLSEEELSNFMIISPTQLPMPLPEANTPNTVVNRARALVLIAQMLRQLYGTSPRATLWMQRTQREDWHHNGLSAKDCLLTGHYIEVFSRLRELTIKRNQPFCGGGHRCSHDFYCQSNPFSGNCS